ncbi:TonB-dependent receptor [Sphingobacterium luzhongxinii]|uniref:TonB-dependent receptor n=1 Tax=Sphingobacterium luzhongxinii TaxID=2654181 RepID=UPI0013DCB0F8|nr:TonB-dependent receptor [Sphingobacterium sp. xlx-73]
MMKNQIKDKSWMVLKYGLLVLSMFLFGFWAQATAQLITLKQSNKRIEKVLEQITERYKIHFLYKDDLLLRMKPVSIDVKDVEIEQVLQGLFRESGITYTRRNNNITLQQSERPNNKQDKIKVTGLVTDSTGSAITGASVALKSNPAIGTATDRNGRFVIEVAPNAVLWVSYMGFTGQELVVTQGKDYKIVLLPDAAGLEEVVVVGFGKQKKESVVSSIATVSGETLRAPTRSLSNNLAGQIPGLIAVQRSGMPGYDDAEFWIRGTSSFAGGTSPLVLVDGIPRSLNDIDPDEIETFSLLKDAAATAVYGAEGANGVILITSKRGKIQKTAIGYRGEYSYSTPTRVPRMANSFDYLRMYNEAQVNDGLLPAFGDDLLDKFRTNADPDLYPSSNWYDLLLRDNTYNTRHNLNFRGGGDRMRFFVNAGFFNESGLFVSSKEYNNNSNYKRYNLRSNIDMDVTNTTTLRVDLAGQYGQVNRPYYDQTVIFDRFSRIPPHLFPAIYSDGTLAAHPSQDNNKVNPYNQLLEYGYRKEWRSSIQSRVDIEQKLPFLTQGLRAKGTVSYDAYGEFQMARTRTPETFVATGRDDEGKLIFVRKTNKTAMGEPTESNSAEKKIYLEASLNYDRVFADRHDVSAMVLTYQKERQLHNQALSFRKQAYVGRVTYSYNRVYSMEANFGITGSEQFAEGNRFGFFPAVGLAYVVTNEPFFPEHLKRYLSNLKLRASVGRTGNDDTGSEANRFIYRGQFGAYSSYPIGIGTTGSLDNLNGLTETRFEAPMIGWEIENKRNFGIDLGLFNNNLQITADYFQNDRYNILLRRRTIVNAAGFMSNPWQNYGKVQNKGVDGSVTYNQKLGTDFSMQLRGNFTFARNKITEYDEVKQVHPWMELTGKRLNGINDVYVADGLFKDDDFNIYTDADGKIAYQLKQGIAPSEQMANPKPGDIRYKDLNGDGIVNAFDRIKDAAMPTVPEIVYGFGTSFKYKGAFLSLFFQGAANVSTNLNNQSNATLPFHWGLLESNVRAEVLESRWTVQQPGQDVFFPRLQTVNMTNTNTGSTYWIRDASFIRLKNVELGYNFDVKKLNIIGIQSIRLYAMGQNVALWDKVKMYDPELGNSAGGTKYPLPSMWTGGLELSF